MYEVPVVSGIQKTMVKVDNFCDYTPFVSTLSNLVDLFIKCVVINCLNPATIKGNHYYTYLKQKSYLRCFILLFPFLGNAVMGIIDFSYGKYKKEVLAALRLDDAILGTVSARLKDDWDFMLDAVEVNGASLVHASDRLKDNDAFMTAALDRNHTAEIYRHASQRLKPRFAPYLAS